MRHVKKRRFPWGVVVIALVAVALIGAGVVQLVTQQGTTPVESLVVQPTTPSTTTPAQAVESGPTITPRETAAYSRPAGCDAWPERQLTPEQVIAGGVGARSVQSLPRDRDESGSVYSPDPTGFNPDVFAWDNESAQVGADGNVLLTAHTYRSDMSALGNRLLEELGEGDLVRVMAEDVTVCYRVTERAVMHVQDYPVDRVYVGDNTPQVVITVCSGFDGQVWTQRTVWFAEPVK